MAIEVLKEKNGYIITKDGVTFKLPRVTKVISYCENFTSSPQFTNWQKRMGGASKAAEYTNQCATLGTKIHNCIESLNRKDIEKYEQKKKELEDTKLIDFSSNKVITDYPKAIKQLEKQEKLFKLDGVIARELTTKQKQIYICNDEIQIAGELDEIIDVDTDILYNPITNKYVKGTLLVDLKNPAKQKQVTYLLGYMLQLAAYSLGWNNLNPEDKINQSLVAIATPSSVNYWYCDPIRLKYYQSWFKKAVRCYLTNTKFDWNNFKLNSGIITTNEGYDRIARNNMLPYKLEIRDF